MSYLQIRNVWKTYEENVILEKLNFTIEKGEFCTLIGPSGCGKSTFLRMLLGQDTPSRGTILLEGEPLSNEPGSDRGVVFQKYTLFPHLRALENVMLGLEMEHSAFLGKTFGSTRRRIKAEAMEMLSSVGLEQSARKYPSELSGGMQQRLSIAQALVKKPKILLLDEPFGALDPGSRSDMQELVKGLWKQYGLTAFMVTHDVKEAFELGTRLLVFDKVRNDPQSPNAFGATIVNDIKLDKNKRKNKGEEHVKNNETTIATERPL
ncbi:MAG: ABC transporter ATP-binding protein [Sulfuricurvum sp.]|jgi:NitT/TauT family transport system ATP-binding protein|uniref:ABC transporter ATP-binding protein n=1 Tax=Sulfuricurvum sp. TaxID=2025608 RepID=UPI0025FF6236|nr:ABC transporter ATP-binding protein [Sulfuricurvum sp.]MCK9372070.1 ABC transporter ATP-binding protein [Sulfuricurvum sp.]